MVDGAAILAMQGASDPCVAPATIRSMVRTNKFEVVRAWIVDPGLFLLSIQNICMLDRIKKHN